MLVSVRECFDKDKYIINLFEKFNLDNEEDIYTMIAKSCIIIRYDDKGEIKRIEESYNKMIKSGAAGFIMLEDDNPIEVNKRLLYDYSYLISTLVNTEGFDYYGRGFLKDSQDNLQFERFIHNLMFLWIHCTHPSKSDSDSSRWRIYPAINKNIIDISKKLDSFFELNNKDTLMYVANILKISDADVKDENIKLLMLTSIIELLLTRNPDSSRFNVEDSINKQFQLKTSIVVYNNRKDLNLNILKEDLKTIYKLRSCIAHGNFKELSRMKLKDEFIISNHIGKLYVYIRCIIEEYIKDPAYIEFIKTS